MYSVKVRDHFMIAHSLPDPAFGPAQNMHGATYVVDTEYFSKQLNAQNVVIDIGLVQTYLKEVLTKLNYQNLDNLPEFDSALTTTEFLAAFIHDQLKEKVGGAFNGTLRVTLGESHVAWASYEGDV
jgi:6-pyruvoyl-tetrahydropterin synthase